MRKFDMFITAVCVLFLVKLRWPKNKSLYDTVFERYGQETLKMVRDYEKDLARFNKASLDIVSCKSASCSTFSQSSSISSLAKMSFMEQEHAAGSRRTC